MAEPRWRRTASQDNDVRHEDHRYQRGLASRTKDIRLMIPYVTRGVFTRRSTPLLLFATLLAISPTLCFTSATPKWTAEYPLATVNIFSFDQATRRRGCWGACDWSSAAITPGPGHAHPAASWGLFAGSLLLFFHPLPQTIQPRGSSSQGLYSFFLWPLF